MTEIALDNNKKETKSLFKTALATILEDAIYIDTVADLGATGHFSPNKGNKLNNHSMDVVVAALEIPRNYLQKQKQHHSIPFQWNGTTTTINTSYNTSASR